MAVSDQERTGTAGSVAGRPHSSIALTPIDTFVRQQEVESLSLKDPNPSPGRPYPVRLLAILISLIAVSGRRVSSNEGRPGRPVYGKCGMRSAECGVGRVQTSDFRVPSPKFRVQSSEFRVQALACCPLCALEFIHFSGFSARRGVAVECRVVSSATHRLRVPLRRAR